jgi:hypothetical protein
VKKSALFVFLASLCSSNAVWADSFHYRLNIDKIPSEKIAAVQSFLSELENHIPQKMKAKIGHEIEVQFDKMDDFDQVLLPQCKPDKEVEDADEKRQKLGEHYWYSSTIHVNAHFIDEILLGPSGTRTYPCGHKSLYRLAQATVIHETAHAYDDEVKVSSDDEFRGLAGWTRSFFTRSWEPKSALRSRSPDRYEFEDLEENFAVETEFFLLDPEFGCRKPAFNDYFIHHFHEDPFPTRPCAVNTKVNLSIPDDPFSINRVDLDRRRI